MRLLLLAPPGAGKGTQGERLAAWSGARHIAAGDLLRAEARGGSRLAREIAACQACGDLVPDQIVLDVLTPAVAEAAAHGGYILDGRGIATYMTYIRSMSENTMPLPYEVQEMTTTEARKHLPELVNMAAYGHVTTVLTRDGRRLARIVPEEDAWVYSPAWQEKLREAEADLAAGRVRRFEDDDEFLGHLDALADEEGG